MKKSTKGLLVALVSLLLGAASVETSMRTFLRTPQMEPANLQPAAGRDFARARMLEAYHEFGLNYRGRPLARVEVYGSEYRHDELGNRAAPGERRDGALRVLVLGDSNTYGWRVGPEQTFCAVAERLANATSETQRPRAIEFVNAGLPGYNTQDALARYRCLREVVAPDVVLLGWFVNDCVTYGFDVDADGYLYFDPFAPPRAIRHTLWRSYTYRWWTLRKSTQMRERGELSADLPQAFQFSIDRIADLKKEVAADGRRFAVLDIPLLEPAVGEQVMKEATYRERQKSAALSRFCTERSIPYLAFLPSLEGEPVALLWGSVDDHHPNARAHEKFAPRLVTFLDELGWLR